MNLFEDAVEKTHTRLWPDPAVSITVPAVGFIKAALPQASALIAILVHLIQK